MWKVVFARPALGDARKLSESGLRSKAEALVAVLAENPMGTPPPNEMLVGSLSGLYCRRINIQHRLVYEVFVDEHTVRVLRMWTHYE